MLQRRSYLGLALGLLLTSSAVAADKQTLSLSCGQKEFLSLEPILVTVRVDDDRVALPAIPGNGKGGTLRFTVEPTVTPRKGAKPLPLEGQAGETKVSMRRYDLFEHFAFPDKGSWTVRAVLEREGGTLTSQPIGITIHKPAAKDREQQPVARIHHVPWSNYDTNAFCGDTFDLVKRWPDSRLARYCHYWNGRYSQNKKEYDKALDSYRTVVDKFADFTLADDAAFGIVECLCAQKKFAEAQKQLAALREKGKSQAGAVQALVEEMDRRIRRDLEAKK